MMNKIYDIIIVGGGPSSLSLAQVCSSIGKSVLIIEKESSLGGCHRVRRVPIKIGNNTEYLFTEHGPRVYGTGYKVFIDLLKDMDLSFYDLFSPYNFSISEIGGQTVWNTLSISELSILAMSFFRMIIDKNYGINISVYDFLKNNSFRINSIDIIDKICRLTDGATSKGYNLNQFLQLFNQHAFSKLYQPKLPNDIGLFKFWQNKLKTNGVDFVFDNKIKNIIQNNNTVSYITSYKNDIYLGKTFVIAVPPENLLSILQNSDSVIQNSFGNLEQLKIWSNKTKYIDYISASFHWNTDLKLDKVYGFPKTEWGIAYIVLSDYMIFEESNSKTVISAAITINDVQSNYSRLYPKQCSKDQILHEIYIQLKQSFPNLPHPTASILSPGVSFNKDINDWVSEDTAFISTSNQPFIYPQSPTIKNLYTLGCHNGNHLYNFTSIEAAVTNGISLSYILYPELKTKYKIHRSIHISDIITILFVCLVLYIICQMNTL